MSGRRATDWLTFSPRRVPEGDTFERRTADRRTECRRAPRRKIDPLFAATLVNQIAPPEAPAALLAEAYERAPRLRAGVVCNRRI